MIVASQVYVWMALVSSAVLIWFSVQGPPAPMARDSNLPHQEILEVMELGNRAYGSWRNASNPFWDRIVPGNGGAVLATNLSNGFHFWARPAMFHHLACLRDIRHQFMKMADGWDAGHFASDRGPDSTYDRLGHCFDYIRQGLLCHADSTLNPVASLSEDNIITDGTILWHTCRENKLLYNWADISGTPRQDPLVHEQWEILD